MCFSSQQVNDGKTGPGLFPVEISTRQPGALCVRFWGVQWQAGVAGSVFALCRAGQSLAVAGDEMPRDGNTMSK